MIDDFRPELRPAAPGAEAPTPPAPTPPGPREWRVQPVSFIWKAGLGVLFALAAVFFADDPIKLVAAGGVTILMAGMALRDVMVRVRLAADSSGVTVATGFTRRRLAWSEIERVRVDARNRLGIRSELLEIDTGTDLYLFSITDLSAPVSEVAEELDRLKAGR